MLTLGIKVPTDEAELGGDSFDGIKILPGMLESLKVFTAAIEVTSDEAELGGENFELTSNGIKVLSDTLESGEVLLKKVTAGIKVTTEAAEFGGTRFGELVNKLRGSNFNANGGWLVCRSSVVPWRTLSPMFCSTKVF